MASRDPETGRFTAGDDGKLESPDYLVLDQKANADTNSPGTWDDWTADEANEGQWQVFEVAQPDDEVLMIHAFETILSDQNELDAANPGQCWYFNGVGPVSEGGFVTKTTVPNFVTYHEFGVQPGGAVTEGRGAGQGGIVRTPITQITGSPLMNASGDITVNWEYIGGNAGEVAFALWYETMEIDDDQLVRELLDQANQSSRFARR